MNNTLKIRNDKPPKTEELLKLFDSLKRYYNADKNLTDKFMVHNLDSQYIDNEIARFS